jgi:ABC-2 type transport system permease protein
LTQPRRRPGTASAAQCWPSGPSSARRSSFWTLLISAGLTIGIGAAFLPIVIDSYGGPADMTGYWAVREGWWFEGLHVGILAVMILGVLVASSEYGTGTIQATLAAIPSRIRVLVAKAASFGAAALVAGAIQAFGAFAAARPILADRSIDVALTDPDALRGVAMATLAVAGAGLFGLGAGLLIRHTAGAIGGVVIVMFVMPILTLLFPASWDDLARVLPSAAMYGMFTPNSATFTAGPATAVFFGYVAALLTVAGVLFSRRDTSGEGQ